MFEAHFDWSIRIPVVSVVYSQRWLIFSARLKLYLWHCILCVAILGGFMHCVELDLSRESFQIPFLKTYFTCWKHVNYLIECLFNYICMFHVFIVLLHFFLKTLYKPQQRQTMYRQWSSDTQIGRSRFSHSTISGWGSQTRAHSPLKPERADLKGVFKPTAYSTLQARGGGPIVCCCTWPALVLLKAQILVQSMKCEIDISDFCHPLYSIENGSTPPTILIHRRNIEHIIGSKH